jgi:DnaJ-class molecular chaperone
MLVDISVDVECTLEEIYYGVTKRFTIVRNVDGLSQTKSFDVTISPGMRTGTTLTLKGQGNQCEGQEPSDVSFTLHEKPHPVFVRDGDD